MQHHRRKPHCSRELRLTGVAADPSPPPSSLPRALHCHVTAQPELGAGLPLSRGCASPFAMSFGATRRTRFPSSCWLLHVCAETLQAPFELAAALWYPYLHAAVCTHAALDSLLLYFSQDDRDAHQLCSREEHQRPQRQHLLGHVFPGWDQDYLGIVRRDDHSLGFGCAASSKSRLLVAKIDACWLAWQANWGC